MMKTIIQRSGFLSKRNNSRLTDIYNSSCIVLDTVAVVYLKVFLILYLLREVDYERQK